MNITDAADALVALEGMVAAVKGQDVQESKFLLVPELPFGNAVRETPVCQVLILP